MKILFVGQADSSHTVRWIRQLEGTGWDCHLFPAEHFRNINPELRNVMVHSLFRTPSLPPTVRESAFIPWSANVGRTFTERLLVRAGVDDARRLARVIRRVKPDVVHSLCVHIGGFPTRAAREIVGTPFPRWLVSNLGLDVYYFRHFEEYAGRIRAVLSSCDEYLCECHRDVPLAREFGFKGKDWPVLPQAGGLDLARMTELRRRRAPSERRLILVKGYQHFYGRALVALKAVELCATDLAGYRVALFGVSGADVEFTARVVSTRTGVPIEIIPRSPHDRILELQSHARVCISLSVADAACTTFLEAMAAGAFPVQSNTGCSAEWAAHGEGALFVDPDDPHDVATALRRAVTDHALVDRAAEVNWGPVVAGLDQEKIRAVVLERYRAP
ncbi:MAG: glycosyltransferase [Steroidobacteraceae bacterium]